MDSPPLSDGPQIQNEGLLLQYWQILQKRRLVVGVFTGLLMVTVAVATKLSTPYYAATAVIEISPKTANVFEVQEVAEFVSATTSSELRNYYATQYKIIQSRSVINHAIQILRDEHGITDFDDADKPVESFRKHLRIDPVVETHLVNITFESPDPDKAILFADTLADAYMKSNLDRAMQSTKDALAWLQSQRTSLKDEKYKADIAIHDFRAKHDLVGISQAYNGSVQRLDKLQEAWGEAATERTRLEARYGELSRLAARTDWAPLANHLAINNPVLRDLLARHDVLQQERSRLAVTMLERAPAMVEISSQIDAVEDQIRQQIDEIVAGEKASLELARTQENALATDLSAVKREVQELDKQLIDLRLLEGDAARSGQFFDDIDRRATEVDLSQLMRNNNIRFIDTAVATDAPVRPNLPVNLAMALVLGLFGGTLLAFGVEYLDVTVKSRDEIEQIIGVPLLGVVPQVPSLDLKALPSDVDRHVYVHARPRSPVAECMRSIRTNVLFRTPQKTVRTLLVTSAAPKEGKSFTSCNLSSIIAMTGSRVLLIDADLRRPSLHRRFGLANDEGLCNLLAGDASFEQVLHHSHVPGLDVIVAGPPPPNPGEMLGSGSLQKMLAQVRGYDFIIIDSPPVNVVADPLVLSAIVDGVLLVVEANRTSRRMVRMAGARLAEVNAPVLGAVVNKLDVRRSGYGYNYYDTYGYYYTENEQFPERETG